jgi:hypothetical protein
MGHRAKVVYDTYIKDRIQPEDEGKYLVIDLETGEFELDADDVAAAMRAYQKKPSAERYLVRIGHRTAGAFRSVTGLVS